MTSPINSNTKNVDNGEIITEYTFPLLSRHFPTKQSVISLCHLPKTKLSGNTSSDGSALNTGISIWFSAMNMIDNIIPILDENVPLNRGSVLELGSGTGLAGLFVLDYFEARGDHIKIDLSDGIDEVLSLLRRNVNNWAQRENSHKKTTDDDKTVKEDKVDVSVHKNRFGCSASCGGFPGIKGGYNLVFASDIIYERDDKSKVRDIALTAMWMLSDTERAVDFDEERNLCSDTKNDEDIRLRAPDEESYLNDLTYDPKIRQGGKIFALGFTRRSYPLGEVVQIFERTGFKYEGTLENSCYDIFENQTDGLTEMWRDCILIFSLGQSGVAEEFDEVCDMRHEQ